MAVIFHLQTMHQERFVSHYSCIGIGEWIFIRDINVRHIETHVQLERHVFCVLRFLQAYRGVCELPPDNFFTIVLVYHQTKDRPTLTFLEEIHVSSLALFTLIIEWSEWHRIGTEPCKPAVCILFGSDWTKARVPALSSKWPWGGQQAWPWRGRHHGDAIQSFPTRVLAARREKARIHCNWTCGLELCSMTPRRAVGEML
jgi:hypothetical protein